MRRAMLALALVGCASQKSAESHADYVAQTQTVRTEGAERVTVTEEDFAVAAPLAAGKEPGEGSVEATNPQRPRGANATASPSGQPQLVRRTVTVTDRAPVITTTHSGTDVHTDAESASRWNLGFGFWTKVLIAAGAALALLLAWRFRSGLLGAGLRLLGK